MVSKADTKTLYDFRSCSISWCNSPAISLVRRFERLCHCRSGQADLLHTRQASSEVWHASFIWKR